MVLRMHAVACVCMHARAPTFACMCASTYVGAGEAVCARACKCTIVKQ